MTAVSSQQTFGPWCETAIADLRSTGRELTQRGTNRPNALVAIADAAFVRSCSGAYLAVRQFHQSSRSDKSTARGFKLTFRRAAQEFTCRGLFGPSRPTHDAAVRPVIAAIRIECRVWYLYPKGTELQLFAANGSSQSWRLAFQRIRTQTSL